MMTSREYRAGQVAALEIAMTVFCPHCHAGYYGRTATNSIRKDGRWDGDMRTATHVIDGRRRRCRAAKLIPLLVMLYPLSDSPPQESRS